MSQTIFCANGCAGDDVAEKGSHHTSAIWKSLPQKRKSAEKVENPVAVICESLPESGKSAEKVEKPAAAVRKSLPESGKSAEKGRDSCSRRLEISTQTAENPGKR